jgi:hypothetical protein
MQECSLRSVSEVNKYSEPIDVVAQDDGHLSVLAKVQLLEAAQVESEGNDSCVGIALHWTYCYERLSRKPRFIIGPATPADPPRGGCHQRIR